MKKYTLLLLIFYITNSCKSQSATVLRAVEIIGAQKWDEANRFLDSILKVSPLDLDAKMMKGNVILNKHLVEQKTAPFLSKLDENIMTDEATHLTDPPSIVSQKCADSVALIWEAEVAKSPDRADIHMGLCTLYGMSLQTDKLIKRLPLLKKYSKQGDQIALAMEDYARLLRDRNRIEDACRVFMAISQLYPNLSAIKSDFAGELLLTDQLAKAKIIATEILNSNAVMDAATRENLTDVFLFSGDVASALLIQNNYARQDTSYRYAKLYESLIRFTSNDEIWKEMMQLQLRNPAFEGDTQVVVQLSRFLSSPDFKNDYDSYLAMVTVPLNTFCSWAVLNKAAMQYPDSVYFRLMLAEFYLGGKNATMANSQFEKAMKLKIDSTLKKDVSFMYAYSLYMAANFKESTKFFQSLLNDENVYRRQAAAYFYGKINKRKDLLETLSNETEKSKYVYLAKLLLPTL